MGIQDSGYYIAFASIIISTIGYIFSVWYTNKNEAKDFLIMNKWLETRKNEHTPSVQAETH